MAEDKASVIDTEKDSQVTSFADARKNRSETDPNADVSPTPPKEEDWKSNGPFIKYNGHATLRSISADEFEAAGAVGQDYAEWNSLNEMKVPKSEFNENALTYLLKVDGRFSEVD